MYSYIYVCSYGKNEVRYSGIAFHEFQRYIEPKIENMILLKGDYFGKSRIVRNFNLFEGREQINLLADETKANGHNFGDFHFLDYTEAESVSKLTDEEIKDILYLSHMWRSVRSPFFETLQNRFVYLAHDDDWSCKLYMTDKESIINVIARKIEEYTECQINGRIGRKCQKNLRNKERKAFVKKVGKSVVCISEHLMQRAFENWNDGIFVDLNGMQIVKNEVIIKLYLIGRFSDMNEMFDNIQKRKGNPVQIRCLCYGENEWSVHQIVENMQDMSRF